ncbi:MAG: extracellular solute-binding protein [Clostridiales bacterium]|nr:extracellular solute-binding protein [Clostridiales bacterium]
MKKTRKIVALVIALVMVFALGVTILTACDNSNTLIWVSESDGVADLTLQQIERFNETWEGEFKIKAKIQGVSEADSATQVLTDVESAPDIYCFAQDQTARLQEAAALSAPGSTAQTKIEAENDASAVTAVKVGGKVVCYPLTSDNGYFMFYDKRVITDSVDKTDLAALVAACEAAKKNFCMETSTSAWYVASFFFGAGCVSTWTTDTSGKFVSVNDTFNSDLGVIAMRGMQQLVKSSCHVSSSDADQFSSGAAIVVTGTWGIDAAVKAIGAENVGYAELPSYTVDGKAYHMGSFSGNKLMGVKPQTDTAKAQAMHALAQYLTSKECQLERFEKFGWGPSNLEAQADDAVKNDPALTALAAQNVHAIPQGQIHGSWWDVAKVLGQNAYDADKDDVTALQEGLKKYADKLDDMLKMTPEEMRAWTVIGSIGGTSWDTDLEMIEGPDNVWTSKDAFDIDDSTAFKIRQGKGWDCQVGANNALNDGGSGDIKLEQFEGLAAGKYYIKVTFTVNDAGNITAANVELVAA